ncbi:hypothetical protein V5F63_09955 [Xanthobacter autotrophicus DSM 597]|uniref:hypothetical protein n=1 Tax=Xanthobacter wiegelii TaxID=3119913 RepID=UPI00372BCF2B
MSELRTSRRSLLKGTGALALVGLPATAAAAQPADPLCTLVTAYRAECAALNATEGDIPDATPLPIWDALNEGRIPAAASNAGAMAALRLAVEMCEDFAGADAIPNLMQAALAFLEGGEA